MIHSLKSLFTVPPWIACLQITDQTFTGVNNLTSYPKQIIYTCLQECDGAGNLICYKIQTNRNLAILDCKID